MLVRVDYNVPIVDGEVVDTARIAASIPTIEYILEKGAIPVLLSHMGRPKGFFEERYSLEQCVKSLQKLLKVPVIFAKDFTSSFLNREKILDKNPKGVVFLLENLRFSKGEESSLSKERGDYAKKIAILGDFFVNDAFSVSHREHASVVELTRFLPSAGGFLLRKELFSVENFSNVESMQQQKEIVIKDIFRLKKTVMILGGSKVEEKLPIIKYLLPRVDQFLLGGGISNTFLKVSGLNVGRSLISEAHVEECLELLREYGQKFVLPRDVVVAKDFDVERSSSELQIRTVRFDKNNFLSNEESIVDIGLQSIEIFTKELRKGGRIFWNGPMGVIENRQTARGTKSLIRVLSRCTKEGADVVIGGGDSLSVLSSGVKKETVGYCCMGGGALLEYLSGKELPGLSVLEEKKN